MLLWFAHACAGAAPDEPGDEPDPVTAAATPIPSEALELVPRLAPEQLEASELRDGRLEQCVDGTACPKTSLAAYDPATARWLVLDVRRSLGEAPRPAWLGVASPGDERALVPRGSAGSTITRALAPYGDLRIAPDIVDAHAKIGLWFGAQVPLVRFGAWCLYIESGGLDRTVDSVHLFDCDGGANHVLATRPSCRGPIDEAGCRQLRDEAMCTETATSLSISSVRRSPDHSSLLIQGHAGPPDHPDAGPFHWVVALPELART